jgi:hypothetical protein
VNSASQKLLLSCSAFTVERSAPNSVKMSEEFVGDELRAQSQNGEDPRVENNGKCLVLFKVFDFSNA